MRSSTAHLVWWVLKCDINGCIFLFKIFFFYAYCLVGSTTCLCSFHWFWFLFLLGWEPIFKSKFKILAGYSPAVNSPCSKDWFETMMKSELFRLLTWHHYNVGWNPHSLFLLFEPKRILPFSFCFVLIFFQNPVSQTTVIE